MDESEMPLKPLNISESSGLMGIPYSIHHSPIIIHILSIEAHVEAAIFTGLRSQQSLSIAVFVSVGNDAGEGCTTSPTVTSSRAVRFRPVGLGGPERAREPETAVTVHFLNPHLPINSHTAHS